MTVKADLQVHRWVKHQANPVLPPGGGAFDANCCMNPFVLRVGDEYCMFYAGADQDDKRRICLATAPVSDLTRWTRLGPVFDVGGPGAFDEAWCVLPCLHRVGGKWHLYYTGRCRFEGTGLQSFCGIGLAISDDLRTWSKYSSEPVLRGDGFPEWPGNRGVAGGGVVVDLPQADGSLRYRMYYTLPTGTPSPDLVVDQAKQCVIAHSSDGIHWDDKRVILRPRLDADYENAATTALVVWRTSRQWRAVYSAIGSRFGAYSICEAVSADGLVWERGAPGRNLSLAPSGDGWESGMCEYASVIREGDKLRLFYCGNGYGATGIGTALAEPLE